MKRTLGIIIMTGILLAGLGAQAHADSWLDSMGESSGVERGMTVASNVSAGTDALRAGVENTMDRSVDFDARMNVLNSASVMIAATNAGGGEGMED